MPLVGCRELLWDSCLGNTRRPCGLHRGCRYSCNVCVGKRFGGTTIRRRAKWHGAASWDVISWQRDQCK